MKKMRRIRKAAEGALAAIILLGLSVANAELASFCEGGYTPEVGQWARYETDLVFVEKKMLGRFAIVGQEDGLFWLEFEATMPTSSDPVVFKVLIPGWPYAHDAVRRALMQLPFAMGDESAPPMEIPARSASKDNLSEPLLMACEQMDKGVSATVTVPAGTFTATHVPIRRLGKDIWVSSSVPFGVVKLVDDKDVGMRLVDYGTGAQPAITQEPMTLPGVELE